MIWLPEEKTPEIGLLPLVHINTDKATIHGTESATEQTIQMKISDLIANIGSSEFNLMFPEYDFSLEPNFRHAFKNESLMLLELVEFSKIWVFLTVFRCNFGVLHALLNFLSISSSISCWLAWVDAALKSGVASSTKYVAYYFDRQYDHWVFPNATTENFS